MNGFYQLVFDVALEAVDRQQPFQSLPEVEQELTLQTHRPCLVVETTKAKGSKLSVRQEKKKNRVLAQVRT